MRVKPGGETELPPAESETAVAGDDLQEINLRDDPAPATGGRAALALERIRSSTKQTLLSADLARSDISPAAKGKERYARRQMPVGLLSRLTFGHFQAVMSTGRCRALETDDLPQLPDEDCAQEIAAKFKRHYARLRRVDAALVATVGRPYLKAALFKLPHDCIVFLTPMLLKALIHLLEADEPQLLEGLLIICALLATGVLQSICLQQYFDRVYRVSYRTMAALNVAIYDKSLVITNTARAATTIGLTVNLISVDVETIASLLTYFQNLLWSAWFQIAVSMVMLYQLVGVSVLAGLLAMFLLMGVNVRLLRRVKRAQGANLLAKDERVKAVAEVLHAMRNVKVLALEPHFVREIESARAREFSALCHFAYLNGFQRSTYELIAVVVSMVTFAVHSMRGLPLELGTVMPSLLLFQLMRFPITMLPNMLSALLSAMLSARRLDRFLQADELSPPPGDAWWPDAPAVVLRRAEFEWTPGTPVLRDLTVQLPRGKLSLIVGAVGAGKSSVLAACLGEMVRTDGNLALQRRIAYVPQQAWVLNESVRSNITFGAPFDAERYARVVACCALREDLAQLHAGDQTEVGEQGIVISGGQKQRISLARACYAGADLYLLDDPLSAVDSHVARHLLEQCILGMLGGTSRVLVTHKLELLPHADHVVVMRDGRAAFQGTYKQLLSSGLDLTVLLPTEKTGAEAEVDAERPGGDADADGGGAKGGGAAVQAEKAEKAEKAARVSRPSGPSAAGDGKLMDAEERVVGGVAAKTWRRYFEAAGALWMSLPVMLGVLAVLSKMATSGWLAWWCSEEDAISRDLAGFVGGYLLWVIATVIVSVGRDCSFAYAELRAASALHNAMLAAVMHAPMAFFDTTPLGRVVARFSKDQDTLDKKLPESFNMLVACLLDVGFTLLLVGAVSPTFFLGIIPIGAVYFYLQRYYSQTARELKRLDSLSRSPLYAFFAETLTGTDSIRAYARQQHFRRTAGARVDAINRVQSALFTANRWLGLRVETLGVSIASLAALTSVLGRVLQGPSASTTDVTKYAALCGLSLSYALSVTNTLGWSVRMVADTETAMNAVERTQHYTELEKEPQTRGGGDGTALAAPRDHSVEFRDYSMRYRDGLPLVLTGVSCRLQHNQRVGIVGRTGSGKSSLAAALLRLVPAASGTILIGGVDAEHIPLRELRAMAAVVPQEPVMFAGPLRKNLDPAGAKGTEELLAALEQVGMRATVVALPDGLATALTENGGNFSVGERQLLCLARAILRRSKLVVLDEATASIDNETDAILQSTIRDVFADATVLSIAHRLHTIMDSTQVMVFDQGELKEFAAPAVLLADEETLFSKLVADTGSAAAYLRDLATETATAAAHRVKTCAETCAETVSNSN